jgi:SAM-dependent methyltransferase
MPRATIARRLRRLATSLKGPQSANQAVPGDLKYLIRNVKVLGSAIARQAYAAGLSGAGVTAPQYPILQRLGGRLCRQADIEAPWLHHWCARLGMLPIYHRKVWEECYVAQALWEAGMLAPGRRGLGFAVGRELLPAFLAGLGVEVLATDLQEDDPRSRVWNSTGQHAGEADHLFYPHLVGDRVQFDSLVRFRPVDMNAIPDDLLDGEFDFCWSVCSFEHLGTVEAGLDFVQRAMDCLRPDGVAVHTTEFNTDADGPTIESGVTVLYQRRHIEALAERLMAEGHSVLPIDFDLGDGVLDRFVDLPPFAEPGGAQVVPDTPHLRMMIAEHACTSIGLIIRKAR